MSTPNQDFPRALLVSLAADFFIISKMLGLIEESRKNFRCNQSMANIYIPLLNSVGIRFSTWEEPFSRMTMFCSPSDDIKEMDDFFAEFEDLCMNVNLGIRRTRNIPMPSIYKDKKDLDTDLCHKYLESIQRFCEYIPNTDNYVEIPISNLANKKEFLHFNLQGQI